MYRSSKGRKLKQMGASTALAVGLIAGGIGIASASTSSAAKARAAVVAKAENHGPDGPGGHGGPGGPDGAAPGGRVSAVTGSSLTITALDGTSHTFSLTAATTVEKDGVAATLSELTVGERVSIRPAAAGSSVASDVEIRSARVAGTVVSVTSSTIVVSDEQGFYRTIAVSSLTTYNKGTASASLSDVVVGTFVMGEGSIDANNTTLDAAAIEIGLPTVGSDGPDGGPGIAG